MTDFLVVVEVALVLPVAIAAALMTRVLDQMADVDPGFAAADTTAFGISLPRTGYVDGDTRNAFFEALASDLRGRADLVVLGGLSPVAGAAGPAGRSGRGAAVRLVENGSAIH
jgi:hypothetical protein